jgi:hypothetical protein
VLTEPALPLPPLAAGVPPEPAGAALAGSGGVGAAPGLSGSAAPPALTIMVVAPRPPVLGDDGDMAAPLPPLPGNPTVLREALSPLSLDAEQPSAAPEPSAIAAARAAARDSSTNEIGSNILCIVERSVRLQSSR